jgi:hypothetical protein
MILLLFVESDKMTAKLVRKNLTSDYKKKFLLLQGRAGHQNFYRAGYRSQKCCALQASIQKTKIFS